MADVTSNVTSLHRRDRETDVFDPDACCMCFGTYEDNVLKAAGAQWIYCKCGKWIHEDCVEESVVDKDGDQRHSTFCVDKYTIDC